MDYKITSLLLAIMLLVWQLIMWKKIKLKEWQDYTFSAIMVLLLGWFVYSFTGRMSTADAMDIECCGLYWHFVDIVWIIIFPVVYLMEYAF